MLRTTADSIAATAPPPAHRLTGSQALFSLANLYEGPVKEWWGNDLDVRPQPIGNQAGFGPHAEATFPTATCRRRANHPGIQSHNHRGKAFLGLSCALRDMRRDQIGGRIMHPEHQSNGIRSAIASRRLALAVALAALLAVSWGFLPSDAQSQVNWPQYLHGNQHSSFSPDATAITAKDAATVKEVWNWMPAAPPIPQLGYILYASPSVYDGVIYIGADNGTFYALNEATGAIIWQRFFGYVSRLSCPGDQQGYFGFVSTAAVANDPVTKSPTLYVNSPDGYLYALDPSNGETLWRNMVGIPSTAENSYYAYSSPAVANGHVYVGISSQCNHPWVRGGVLSFDQRTGTQKAVFYNVPPKKVGASVWSSVAVGKGGVVYETTGSGPTSNQLLGKSESIVALDGKTLAELGGWQIPSSPPPPPDSDFGASPTLFSAVLPGSTQPVAMIGACNKDGTYYALRADDIGAGPVWTHVVFAGLDECITAAAWNGRDLFLGTPRTTVDGTTHPGAIMELNPATGAVLWATALPGQVYGSPSLDGKGVLAVATFGGQKELYLVDANSGKVLKRLAYGPKKCCGEFAVPVYADQYVLAATLAGGLTAYSPSSG